MQCSYHCHTAGISKTYGILLEGVLWECSSRWRDQSHILGQDGLLHSRAWDAPSPLEKGGRLRMEWGDRGVQFLKSSESRENSETPRYQARESRMVASHESEGGRNSGVLKMSRTPPTGRVLFLGRRIFLSIFIRYPFRDKREGDTGSDYSCYPDTPIRGTKVACYTGGNATDCNNGNHQDDGDITSASRHAELLSQSTSPWMGEFLTAVNGWAKAREFPSHFWAGQVEFYYYYYFLSKIWKIWWNLVWLFYHKYIYVNLWTKKCRLWECR